MKFKSAFVLFLILLSVGSGWTQQKTVSSDFVQKQIARGKQYCFFIFKQGPNFNKIDSLTIEKDQIAHLQYLFTLKQAGKLPLFGPLTDGDYLRGIGIFNLKDKGAVKKLLDEDPHVKSGRLSYEIYSWIGLPGDKLP